MSRIVIRHKQKIPLMAEAYDKMAEFDKPYGVGLLGGLHWEGTNKIVFFYSTDGKNFDYLDTGLTYQTAFGNQTPTSAAFSTQLNRYVATSGITSLALGYVIYSDNLKNWFTASTAFIYSQDMLDIAYSDTLNLFVAVGENKPQYSTTGVGWTLSTSSVNSYWSKVKWISSLNKFYASYTTSFANSSNGINWTQGTCSLITDFAYSSLSNRFVGVYGSNSFSFSDDNGATWAYITQSFGSFSSVDWRGIEYSEPLDLFIAVGLRPITGGISNNIFAVSKTGLTWSVVIGPRDSWTDLTWSEEFQEFAMFPGNANYSNSSQFAGSFDGYNWFTSSQHGGTAMSGTTIKLVSMPNILI